MSFWYRRALDIHLVNIVFQTVAATCSFQLHQETAWWMVFNVASVGFSLTLSAIACASYERRGIR